MRCRARAAWLAVALAAGCTEEAEPVSQPPPADPADAGRSEDVPPPVEMDPPECDEGLSARRVLAWPGGGVQVAITLSAPAFGGEIRVTAGGRAWTTAWASAAGEPGITAVLLAEPGGAAARDLVQTLPAGERVGLWQLADDGVELLSEVTHRRDHVLARLAEANPALAPAGPGVAEAVRLLRDRLAALEGPFGRLHRDLLVFGGGEPGASSGAELAAGIAAARDRTLRVGACPPADTPAPALLEVHVGELGCRFAAPASHGLVDPACDAVAAAGDDHPFGEDVAFTFNPAQREVHAARYADKSKDSFEVTVRVGAGPQWPATAHLRGHTSLACDRANYSVNLTGKTPRRLLPGGGGDKVHLISMCKDEGYFNQVFANRLLARLGLFELSLRYVKMRVDGENRGVYLLLEQADQRLRADRTAVAVVLRRRFDPHDDPVDVKHPGNPEEQGPLVAAYEALSTLAQEGAPEGLARSLADSMDLDAYLTWVAFQSLFLNGDYVDEAYFHASREAGSLYFRHLGWDPDDLFAACHHQGRFAWADPHGLVFCSEAKIEAAIHRSDEVYALYVDALEGLLSDSLPAAVLRETMEGVRDDLWARLDDDETAAAMVELLADHPSAATMEGARAEIRAQMDRMLARAEERRAVLLERVRAYHSEQP